MFDGANDDNGGTENRGRNGHSDANAATTVSLATLFGGTMWGSSHGNVLTYWSSLRGELDGTRAQAAAHIMYYNWMTVPEPIDCVASKVITRKERDAEKLLSGLRRFRDQALRPLSAGRELINIYYRNSPELALLIVNDVAASRDALRVVRLFAELGDTSSNHAAYVKLAAKGGPLLGSDDAAAIDRLLALISAKGSPALNLDAAKARDRFATMKKMSLATLTSFIAGLAKGSKQAAGLPTLEPGNLNPASVEALKTPVLREVLRKGMPAP